MPTVPRYSDPTVKQAGLPDTRSNIQAPLEAFGGGDSQQLLGKSIANTLDIGQKVLAEERYRADELAIADADNNLSALETELEIGARKYKGKNALDAQDYVNETWNKKLEDIRKNLANDRQKLAIDKRAGARFNSLNNAVSKHMASEMDAFADATGEATIQNAKNLAVVRAQDDNAIADQLGLIGEAVDGYTARKGFNTPEIQQSLKTKHFSEVHRSVIASRLSADQDVSAKAYFDKYKTQIAEGDMVPIERMLEEGTTRIQSQRTTRQIVSSSLNERAALEKVDQLKDGKLKDETRKRVIQYFSDQNQALQHDQTDSFRVALDVAHKNGIDKVPSELRDRMGVEKWNTLVKQYEMDRDGVEGPRNSKEWFDLYMMATTPETRSQFLKVPLYEKRHLMSNANFDQLINLYQGIQKKDEKTELDLNSAKITNELVKDAFSSRGMDPTPKDKTKAAKDLAEFHGKFRERVIEKQNQMGRKLNDVEQKQIIDELFIQKRVKRGIKGFFGFDSDVYNYQLQPGEGNAPVAQPSAQPSPSAGPSPQIIQVSSVTEVPSASIPMIKTFLKTKGIEATDENIVNAYNAAVKAKATRGK